jgi:hypothetical protein
MQILVWEDRRNPYLPRAVIQQGRCDVGQCGQFSISISNGERGMTVRFESEDEFRQFLRGRHHGASHRRVDGETGGRRLSVRHGTSPDSPGPRSRYGAAFERRVVGMGGAEVVSAPARPWQNPYVERVIGSIRRECLDHVIVLNEAHLRRVLTSYVRYYHRRRTHLALEKDTPDRRPAGKTSRGPIIVTPEVGGLHHRYERRVA